MPTEKTAATSPPRQTTRGELKRASILDAAAEIFAEIGYERASIDAIAGRAQVSKPTVYSHFGNKETLFRESIANSAAQVNAASLAALGEWDPQCIEWREGLIGLAEQLVTCQRSPCAVSLNQQIHAEIGRDPQIYRLVTERVTTPIVDGLAGRLAMVGNAGRLRIDDPVLAARQFLALITAELPTLTDLGTTAISDERARTAVRHGVEVFLRAYVA
ncbi:TetR/AcrR family transcriptional regulator [Gordonia sp. NPDC003376]